MKQLTIDQAIARLAARLGITLSAAAELLQEDPELVDTIAGDSDPPAIDPAPQKESNNPA